MNHLYRSRLEKFVLLKICTFKQCYSSEFISNLPGHSWIFETKLSVLNCIRYLVKLLKICIGTAHCNLILVSVSRLASINFGLALNKTNNYLRITNARTYNEPIKGCWQ